MKYLDQLSGHLSRLMGKGNNDQDQAAGPAEAERLALAQEYVRKEAEIETMFNKIFELIESNKAVLQTSLDVQIVLALNRELFFINKSRYKKNSETEVSKEEMIRRIEELDVLKKALSLSAIYLRVQIDQGSTG